MRSNLPGAPKAKGVGAEEHGPPKSKQITPWNVHQQEFAKRVPFDRTDPQRWYDEQSAQYQAQKDTELARWTAEADVRNAAAEAHAPSDEEVRTR